MGVDGAGIDEMLSLLRGRGVVSTPEQILDGPFAPKRFLASRTRFSDGRIRIYYSALDYETAEAEVYHWTVRPLLQGMANRRPVFYQRAACQFEGVIKDLRPKLQDWPFLVANLGYDDCNRIGAEAEALDLGGLLSQSARRPQGTTLPVFRRDCLSKPRVEGVKVFIYDPALNPPLSVQETLG
jgi:hypothetical protein